DLRQINSVARHIAPPTSADASALSAGQHLKASRRGACFAAVLAVCTHRQRTADPDAMAPPGEQPAADGQTAEVSVAAETAGDDRLVGGGVGNQFGCHDHPFVTASSASFPVQYRAPIVCSIKLL